MEIRNTEVYGFRRSLYAMRNPMNSWDKSDSTYIQQHNTPLVKWNNILVQEMPQIGPTDMKLACRLIKAGPEHRKFLRQIMIWVDITIPRYVWQELDTYKISTVRNSCSTMHKLGQTDLAQCDFEQKIPDFLLQHLNKIAKEYRNARILKETKVANILQRQMKGLLPEGFLQKATYTFNYETALNMYFQRNKHRLPEWNEKSETSICSWLKSLPYMKDFIEAKK